MDRSTILLVDDNPQILNILSDLLQPLGYRLLRASSGAEALEIAAAHHPDLILLDVMMPEIDGFAVCQQLRADADLAHVPVIMITALDDRESRMRGFEAGADDFIAKPFDYAELRARISTVLRLNRYRRLIEEQARVSAERARFAWAVEQSDDAYLMIGPDDQVRYANPRARHLLGVGTAASFDQPFAAIAARQYYLVPPEAWARWPNPAPTEVHYLVRPEAVNASEFWLRADLLSPPPGGDDSRAVRLRDVTAQITSQREMWTFHAMLTHKLRTPLVSIIGGLSILADGNATLDQAAVQRIARLSMAGARRLQSEIEDILNYLRPPTDLYGSDPCLIADLPALITSVASDIGLHDVTVWLEPDIAPARLTLARHSLEVVLRELLENARKFHPQQAPTVTATIDSHAGGTLLIRVSDNGPGISPDQITRVWRPYYQGEKNFTGQVDGMGLGLALVARIVFAVGGRYAIRNRDDATGITVEIELPYASTRV